MPSASQLAPNVNRSAPDFLPVLRGHAGRTAQAKKTQGEELRTLELHGDSGEHGSRQHHDDAGDNAADGGGGDRDPQGLARLSLLGHGIAVEHGTYRRRCTGGPQ